MDSFKKHLETYDKTKLENAMKKVMKSLASTLSRQRGIQYEFGPEFDEYTAQKAGSGEGFVNVCYRSDRALKIVMWG